MEKSLDKAGESYWSSFWKSAATLPPPAYQDGKITGSYVVKELDQFFTDTFKKLNQTEGLELLEAGCGNSIWLSYFNKKFGFNVSGIDYSEFGCNQTRSILKRDEVKGNIYHVDIFNPPADFKEKYDVVCSFGVVEHFNDTVSVLKALSFFLKPGGIIITTVPNLMGPTGLLQKIFNKPVYDIHVIMDKEYLKNNLEKAGYQVNRCNYFCSFSFGVTFDEINNKPVRFLFIKKLIVKVFQLLAKPLHFIDAKCISLPKNRLTSEGIFTAAVKPGNKGK